MRRACLSFLALVVVAGCTEQPTTSAVRRPAQGTPTPVVRALRANDVGTPLTAKYSGWVERAFAYSSTPYDTISAYWTVPNNPTGSYADTLVWYATFPALENLKGMTGAAILQPVLRFTGAEGWLLLIEDCHGVLHTPATCPLYDWSTQPSYPGDIVYGRVSDSSCSPGHTSCTWRIVARDTSLGFAISNTVTDTLGPFVKAIGGAVEVDGISQCAQYPFSGVSYHGISLYAGNQKVTPAWTGSVAAGISPSCSFGVYANVDTVKLYHNYPPPAPLSVTISGPRWVRPNTPCRYVAVPTGGARPITYGWIPVGTQQDSSVIEILSWQANLQLFATDSLNQQARASKMITVTPSAPPCPSAPVR